MYNIIKIEMIKVILMIRMLLIIAEGLSIGGLIEHYSNDSAVILWVITTFLLCYLVWDIGKIYLDRHRKSKTIKLENKIKQEELKKTKEGDKNVEI